MTEALKNLESFIEAEKRKYESLVLKETKKLKLKDIIEKVLDLNDLVNDIIYQQNNFKYGNKIKFRLSPYWYYINLEPDKLQVEYSDFYNLRTFSGTHVKKLYNHLAKAVEEKIEENNKNDDLPF